MKKIMMFLWLFLCSFTMVQGNTRESATLGKCVDGDTSHFIVQGKTLKVRYLAIDAPEYTNTKEPYGKEASAYVCNALNEAKTIELEYDDGSDRLDKYGRTLAWVFVDGKLLQEELIKQGLAEVKYLYGDYAYTDMLKEAQQQAKGQRLNLWSEDDSLHDTTVLAFAGTAGGVVLILVGFFFAKDKRTKTRLIRQGLRTVKRSRKR